KTYARCTRRLKEPGNYCPGELSRGDRGGVRVLLEADDAPLAQPEHVREGRRHRPAGGAVRAVVLAERDDRLAGVEPAADLGSPPLPLASEPVEHAVHHRLHADVPAAAGKTFALDPFDAGIEDRQDLLAVLLGEGLI